MIKIISFIVLFGLISTTANAQFAGGSGSEEDPFLIETADQLDAIRDYSRVGNAYRQIKDIDLGEWISNHPDKEIREKGWNPITIQVGASSATPMSFDGGEFTIKGLYINNESLSGGLFGQLQNGSLKNIRITDCNIKANGSTGALVGYYYMSGKNVEITNCQASGKVTGESYIGGLIGSIYRNSTYGNSYSLTISSCQTAMEVKGSHEVGGLIGNIQYSNVKVTDCYTNSFITGNDIYTMGSDNFHSSIGGLVGKSEGTITNSYSSGFVSGPGSIGGIVGYNYGGTVTNCVAANQQINGNNNVGRVVGYSTGTIYQNVGLESMLVNGEKTNGSSNSANGSDKSYEDLCRKNTYLQINWNFSNVWDIWEENALPHFSTKPAAPVMTTGTKAKDSFLEGKADPAQISRVWVQVNEEEAESVTVSGNGNWEMQLKRPLNGHDRISIKGISANEQESNTQKITVLYLGEGKETDPYRIHNADELNNIRYNYFYAHYRVEENIDLKEWLNNHPDTSRRKYGWEPLGETRNSPFKGVFDGGGNAIKGLFIYCDDIHAEYKGLIAWAEANTIIKNLNVEDCDIAVNTEAEVGNTSTAALVGFCSGKISFLNCKVTGSIINLGYTGGLIAFVQYKNYDGREKEATIINNCYVNATIQSKIYSAGGLIGYSATMHEIYECQFIGNITAKMIAGGIIAGGSEGKISRSSTSAFLVGERVGGIAGGGGSTINNCYSSSIINSSISAGGLASENSTPNANISNSYVSGKISGNNVGGISYNSYSYSNNVAALSSITGSGKEVNRISGYSLRDYGENNFALASMLVNNQLITTGTASNENGENVELATLLTRNFYESRLNWDFQNTWSIIEGKNLPYLTFQAPPPIIETEIRKSVTHLEGSYNINEIENVFVQVNGSVIQKATLTNGSWRIELKAPLKTGDAILIWAENSTGNPSYAHATQIEFEEGAGIENDPFVIKDAGDLNAVRNYTKAYYILNNDIDLKEWIANNPDEDIALYGWKPIGNRENEFTGYLNGNNFKIYGLRIDRPDTKHVGLFGMVTSGLIQNLRVEGVEINGGEYTGGLVGEHTSSFLQNVFVSGKVNGGNLTGGIAGYVGGGAYTNCGFNGKVSGKDYTAGLYGSCTVAAGMWSGSVTRINNCYASAIVKGNEYVGGILGYALGSKLEWIEGAEVNVNIADCYSTGKIEGVSNVGGIVGKCMQNREFGEGETLVTLDRCYSSAYIISGDYSGGITGTAGTISSSIATNPSLINSSGSNYGRITSRSSFLNSNYALATMLVNRITTTGSLNSYNGENKIMEELEKQNTYTSLGWDFETRWEIREGNSLPYFKFQTYPPVITSEIKQGTTKVQGEYEGEDGTQISLLIKERLFHVNLSLGNWSLDLDAPLTIGDELMVWAEDIERKVSYGNFYSISYEEGDGSENNPYLIHTADELNAIRRDLSAHYQLVNDIDLTEWVRTHSDEDIRNGGWVPVGSKSSQFTGTLDGNNHSIEGLFINRPESDYVGLFSYVASSGIKRIRFNDAQVTGGNVTGILAGAMLRTISECTVSGNVSGKNCVGGIVGLLDYGDNIPAKVTQCNFTGTVNGYDFIGGLIGGLNRELSTPQNGPYSTTISDCYARGKVEGNNYLGGIIGYIDNEIYSSTYAQSYEVEILRSYFSGEVLGSNNIGGIVGEVTSTKQNAEGLLTISDCYTTGLLKGKNNVGGILGFNDAYYYSLVIDNSYSAAYVFGDNYLGGISGHGSYTDLINNSVAMNPAISASSYTSHIGRVVGSTSRLENTYGSEEILLMDESAKKYLSPEEVTGSHGVFIQEDRLRSSDFYRSLEWDFDNTWGIWEGNSLPYFSSFTGLYGYNQLPAPTLSTEIVKGVSQLEGIFGLPPSASISLNDIEVFIKINDNGIKKATVQDNGWSFTADSPLEEWDVIQLWSYCDDYDESAVIFAVVIPEGFLTGQEQIEASDGFRVLVNYQTSNIEISGLQNYIGANMTIHNLQGQIYRIEKIGEDFLQLDLSVYPEGVYLITIRDKTVKVFKR